MNQLIELVERFVNAIERIAACLERTEPKPRTRSRNRGLRTPTTRKSETVVPTELDRARASKALKKHGY